MKRLFAPMLLAAIAFSPAARAADPAPIGTATMAPDGTITLWLRAELPDHAGVGHGTIVYKSDDPKYRDVLQHLGGLKPGEVKLVQPWPDEK